MAYIKTIPQRKSIGERAEAYDYLSNIWGIKAPVNIVQMFSLRPGTMRSMIRRWELSMWIGSAPRIMREMIAV